MRRIGRLVLALGYLCCTAFFALPSLAEIPEYNPISKAPIAIGAEANRFIVGFRSTPSNAVTNRLTVARRQRTYTMTQAQTSAANVKALVQRAGVSLAASRQITPSMHVLLLPKKLYGADVDTTLAKLRADPAVEFAVVDQLRYPLGLTVPNDPLFVPTSGASGQWYLNAPNSSITVQGVQTKDLAATDAVDAWSITTGSAGIVIADVDTGVRFDHPDLLRAGFGGRLLPGYDFVGQDYNATTGVALGTYLKANDGDGWDPDPSDPGDWISSSDLSNAIFTGDTVEASSWHGTRVVGIFGALTNNDTGIAGMSWGSWVLPVRALGKGGGYDSDIIAGIEWAAGLSVQDASGIAVPVNPYPADIINLSIGGNTDACSSSNGAAYKSALTTVTGMGVLVVIAAGNASGPVELPGNCAGVVAGVMAVAGLRNVGTKVGYSSFGPEVSVSAPAGNCVNSSGACLRSIDTTTNLGTTVPAGNSYTNETNSNLGTSFATPIVAGIAALMRSVNDNLTPSQLAARLEASASAFPANTGNIPVCPSVDTADGSDQCSCPATGECGAGMVNAYQAVLAAQRPIAAVAIPTIVAGSHAVLDASGSAASCGRTVKTYAWTASGAVTIVSGNATSQVTILPGNGTLTLTVTDNIGATDSATITVTSNSASTSAPTNAGSAACPTALDVVPLSPTVEQTFSPSSVSENSVASLIFTLNNANGFALTQSTFNNTLPSGLTVVGSPAPTTTCAGTNSSLVVAGTTITLSNANIPANGTCTVALNVSAAASGTFTNTVAVNALTTGPAGGNVTTSSSILTVTPPQPPMVSEVFSPSSVAVNASTTLTINLSNPNTYALTAVGLNHTVPSGLTIGTSPAAKTTCGGTLSASASSIVLSGASIVGSNSCLVTLTLSGSTAGNYVDSIAVNDVVSAQAGGNTTGASANLTITAASSSSGGSSSGSSGTGSSGASAGTSGTAASSTKGGGALSWFDLIFCGGLLIVGRRHALSRSAGL